MNNTTTYPRGTSKAYGLRILEEKRPDLLARVKAGELSAYAAMREAGHYKRRIFINAEDPVSAAATLRKHASPAFLEGLLRLLSHEDGSEARG